MVRRRTQVLGLIGELLDERELDVGLRQALIGERVMLLDSITYYTRSNPLLKPMFDLEQARALQRSRAAFGVIATVGLVCVQASSRQHRRETTAGEVHFIIADHQLDPHSLT